MLDEVKVNEVSIKESSKMKIIKQKEKYNNSKKPIIAEKLPGEIHILRKEGKDKIVEIELYETGKVASTSLLKYLL